MISEEVMASYCLKRPRRADMKEAYALGDPRFRTLRPRQTGPRP